MMMLVPNSVFLITFLFQLIIALEKVPTSFPTLYNADHWYEFSNINNAPAVTQSFITLKIRLF